MKNPKNEILKLPRHNMSATPASDTGGNKSDSEPMNMTQISGMLETSIAEIDSDNIGQCITTLSEIAIGCRRREAIHLREMVKMREKPYEYVLNFLNTFKNGDNSDDVVTVGDKILQAIFQLSN